MVVAMVPVGMVQPAPDQIIHMVAVGNGLMSALWSMNVFGVMSIAAVRAYPDVLDARPQCDRTPGRVDARD